MLVHIPGNCLSFYFKKILTTGSESGLYVCEPLITSYYYIVADRGDGLKGQKVKMITMRGGQKWVCSCEEAKHRLFLCYYLLIIVLLSI